MLGPRRFGRLLALLAFVSILALVASPAGARPPRVEVFPKSGSVHAASVDAVTAWNANAGRAALDACLAPKAVDEGIKHGRKIGNRAVNHFLQPVH
jgi:hypothetical protein